jgi:hypothetical protein
MFIPCISKAQLTPRRISDFTYGKRIELIDLCWDYEKKKIKVGELCNPALLSIDKNEYQKITNLMTPRAFNKEIKKSFLYTVAGDEKASNSISVDIASPKAKFSGMIDVKDNKGKSSGVLLKTDFTGSLNEDGTRSPIYSSNNFNTSLGFNFGVLILEGNNNKKYIIDGNLKKSIHQQIINNTNILQKRAKELMMLYRWANLIYLDVDIVDTNSDVWNDDMYEEYTSKFTKKCNDNKNCFKTFLRKSVKDKYESVKFSELYKYFDEYKDIKIPKSVLENIIRNSTKNFDYSFLEDKVDEIQDSLVTPYWTKSVLKWWSADIGIKNSMLNENNTVGDKKVGLAFYDIFLTGSFNRLFSNPVKTTQFLLLRGYVFVGRGTNIKNLRTIKIDKDLFYDGKIIQLNTAGFGGEVYGNPFKQVGVPGLYMSARFDYSAEFRNPWIISAEIGPMFNLQDKKSNNFAYIIPTFGFLDIAEPGIDIADGFIFNLKFGIPINLKAK